MQQILLIKLLLNVCLMSGQYPNNNGQLWMIFSRARRFSRRLIYHICSQNRHFLHSLFSLSAFSLIWKYIGIHMLKVWYLLYFTTSKVRNSHILLRFVQSNTFVLHATNIGTVNGKEIALGIILTVIDFSHIRDSNWDL